MSLRCASFAAGLLSSLLAITAGAAEPVTAAAEAPVRVVYQISDGNEQALRGLRNIGNHLNADPMAKIVVVALGRGVDFLIDGAKDANGQPFDAMVAGLTARQVQFRICANTLHTLKVTTDRINPEAVVVPSGEIGRAHV